MRFELAVKTPNSFIETPPPEQVAGNALCGGAGRVHARPAPRPTQELGGGGTTEVITCDNGVITIRICYSPYFVYCVRWNPS